LEYLASPYGTKGAYLREHDLSSDQMRVWRRQVYAGSLERGLVPRGELVSSVEDNREIVRLARENEALTQQLQAQAEAHQAALAAKEAELAGAARTVDALGKAIALLHAGNESARGTTGP
jgi:transposase-like protein